MSARHGAPGVFVRGLAMGIVEVIPGVSGGTIAFITGIYERLLAALASWSPRSVRALVRGGDRSAHDLGFLAVLAVGMALGYLGTARLIGHLLDAYGLLVWSFFFGLIAGSAWHLGRRLGLRHAATFGIAGTVLGAFVATLGAGRVDPGYLQFFLGGGLATAAWMLPGDFRRVRACLPARALRAVSWAAVNGLRIDILAAAGRRHRGGDSCFSRRSSPSCSAAFRRAVLATLTGLMAGSLLRLWPWRTDEALLSPGGVSAGDRQRSDAARGRARGVGPGRRAPSSCCGSDRRGPEVNRWVVERPRAAASGCKIWDFGGTDDTVSEGGNGWWPRPWRWPLAAGCATSPSQAPVVERSTPVGDPPPERYVVQPRDSLYAIAWRYGLDYVALARWNGIGPPYTIYPGQTLMLAPEVGVRAGRPARPAHAPRRTFALNRSVPRAEPETQAARRTVTPTAPEVRTPGVPEPAPARPAKPRDPVKPATRPAAPESSPPAARAAPGRAASGGAAAAGGRHPGRALALGPSTCNRSADSGGTTRASTTPCRREGPWWPRRRVVSCIRGPGSPATGTW